MAVTYHIQTITPGGTTEHILTDGSSLVINRKVNGASTATWRVIAMSAATAPLWPHGAEIAIIRKTTGQPDERLFRGTSITPRHLLVGDSECIQYIAQDAWWHLDREIFKSDRITTGNAAYAETGRALLFRSPDGVTPYPVEVAIMAAASYGIGMGIPLQLGDVDAPTKPPASELADRSCAEIILTALRWQPDAAAWIDHATEPPTLHVTRLAKLPPATVRISPDGDENTISVTPRRDLVVPGVEIVFERGGGIAAVQTAGNPAAPGCARMTIRLDSQAATASAPEMEIKTVPLGDYDKLAWWQQMFPWLPASAVITEPRAMPAIPPGYDNILVVGQITQWMQDKRDLYAGTFTVSCVATGEFEVDGRTFTEKDLSRTFTLTNAKTHRYRGGWRIGGGFSEPVPEGLAQSFYDAIKSLQYEGTVHTVENECTAGRNLIGKSLNLDGGLPEWASMLARVISVRENLDTGETDIAFGPQNHLGPQDLIELIRAARMRDTRSNITIPPDDEGEDQEDINPFAPEDRASNSPGQMSALELIEGS